MTYQKWWTIHILSKIAIQNPIALPLVAQLIGVAPCKECNYVKQYCRCHDDGKGVQ